VNELYFVLSRQAAAAIIRREVSGRHSAKAPDDPASVPVVDRLKRVLRQDPALAASVLDASRDGGGGGAGGGGSTVAGNGGGGGGGGDARASNEDEGGKGGCVDKAEDAGGEEAQEDDVELDPGPGFFFRSKRLCIHECH